MPNISNTCLNFTTNTSENTLPQVNKSNLGEFLPSASHRCSLFSILCFGSEAKVTEAPNPNLLSQTSSISRASLPLALGTLKTFNRTRYWFCWHSGTARRCFETVFPKLRFHDRSSVESEEKVLCGKILAERKDVEERRILDPGRAPNLLHPGS